MTSASGSNLRSELASLRREVKRLRRELAAAFPPLAVLLRRRGFRIYKKEPPADLLLPDTANLDGFYGLLHKYSFRLFLRDVIKHQKRFALDQVARYPGPEVAATYVSYLRELGMLRRRQAVFSLAKGAITSFGATLEWYVAEVLKREFGAEAIRSVKFRRPKVGGDYDVIARLGNRLVYVEVKSSPPKQIYDSEISAFLDRVEDLRPHAAIFLMDTELRMKDKLVPMFEKALAERGLPAEVERLERELFHVQYNVFIMNAKESIVRNLETILGRTERHGTAPLTPAVRRRASTGGTP